MNNSRSRTWIYDVLFVLILLVAAYFRLMGLNWDQSQHLHPDERFLTMVESAMTPVKTLGEYFDTDKSTLNPHNVGFGFYVYGDLPITIVRYAADTMSEFSKWAADFTQAHGTDGPINSWLAKVGETTNWAGYDEVALVGRVLSALSDLGSILLLYVIVVRLYGRKVAVLAAAFSALAVLQIQQSHFFTVDTFANLFIFLATYFAVEIMVGEEEIVLDFSSGEAIWKMVSSPLVLNTLGFGLALGASVASKINAAPLAVLLPGALIIRYFRTRTQAQKTEIKAPEPVTDAETTVEPVVVARPRPAVISSETVIVLVILGALISAIAFRVFQPYAFSGPGFFGLKPNPKWVANIVEQRNQASGDVDFPPALQWARRPIWFSGYNLVAWGLGWPLGILAWIGFLYMGWRILKGEWKEHILLWGWIGGYFAWQSLQWNPTMRYELPIYPLLAMTAAWFIFKGPRSIKALFNGGEEQNTNYVVQVAYAVLGVIVLAGAFGWTYAFTRIYTRDHSRVQATHWIYQNVPGPYNLKIQQPDETVFTQPMSMPPGYVINQDVPYDVQFTAFASGNLTDIFLANAANMGAPGPETLNISISAEPGGQAEKALATATLVNDFAVKSDPRGEAYTLTFDKPVALEKGRTYFLHFITTGPLALAGSAPVHESSWDDGLPLRMDGYDAYGGMYRGDLNFEMYYDDNADKLTRFETNLDAGDYIFITSNRQWATTTRVPERYPLTTVYYRNLIGCPEGKDIIWCYNVAEPGMFKGNLGFELVKTFTSYPEIFGYQFNTQFAEEAFTVYDAPKVLIFKKTDAYNPETVRSILGAVDLTKVIHVTPRQAGKLTSTATGNVPSLLLPANRLDAQQAGGTWSDLFSYESIQNKFPVIGLIIWYLAIGLLGLFTWPLVRLLLPGLPDKGYPLARLTGLLLLAYGVWLVASVGGQYSRGVIAAGYGFIVVAGIAAFIWKHDEIREEVRDKGKYILLVEILFLAFFLIDLTIRLGNPDLWHPARGGERPMDFAYLNAVIRSTSFPPYDPWFAGGYINYYYWGYVLVGTPIKLFGIVPSIAYNFVLPTLFAMLGIGGFSVAWNLLEGFRAKDSAEISPFTLKLIVGIAAGAGLVLLGNLGTVRLIYHALQKLVVSSDMVDNTDVWAYQHLLWGLQGLGRMFSGAPLPIGTGEYYWAPSRVMPPNDLAITEFPLFTFIYSDLHAHMIALPLTVLSIAWTLSMLLVRKLKPWSWLLTLAFGGLVIGALRPTNTWDFPTYLTLGAIVTAYAMFRYADVRERNGLGISPVIIRAILAVISVGVLVAFFYILYQPFSQWFGQAYTQVSQWTDEKTPIWSYWTHWGLFLFVIISWLIWETRQWLAQTPVSALSKLKPYELFIEIGVAVFIALWLVLQFILNVPIAWFAFPVGVWALILMFRPGQPDSKRLVLFMVATGIVLTLAVEFIVLVGDIGRMNTVFKFYIQVWTLFAISAAAALGWILTEFDEWGKIGKNIFQVGGAILVLCALLYPFTAAMDKIRDRMSPNTPFTFDSMTYMNYSHYNDNGTDMDLSQDYRAIRWLEDNVKGSPVVLEAAPAGIQYTWFSRISIYTGLPTVVGWQWHEEQQRGLMPAGTVAARGVEAQLFYNTYDINMVKDFLTKYKVRYIVVGQQERIRFPGALSKFKDYDGQLWKQVYQDADTDIYEVIQ